MGERTWLMKVFDSFFMYEKNLMEYFILGTGWSKLFRVYAAFVSF